MNRWFRSYLWGIETHGRVFENKFNSCSDLTYEELKRFNLFSYSFCNACSDLTYEELKHKYVLEEPVSERVQILPMRNWNPYFAISVWLTPVISFRSYLWGIETGSSIRWYRLEFIRSDLTYEELKLNLASGFMFDARKCSDLTYEELKRHAPVFLLTSI